MSILGNAIVSIYTVAIRTVEQCIGVKLKRVAKLTCPKCQERVCPDCYERRIPTFRNCGESGHMSYECDEYCVPNIVQ
jgi:hypothetical protein